MLLGVLWLRFLVGLLALPSEDCYAWHDLMLRWCLQLRLCWEQGGVDEF